MRPAGFNHGKVNRYVFLLCYLAKRSANHPLPLDLPRNVVPVADERAVALVEVDLGSLCGDDGFGRFGVVLGFQQGVESPLQRTVVIVEPAVLRQHKVADGREALLL